MNRNTRTALLAALLVCSMTGLAFASVPLYRIFCQVTGFGGTTRMAVGTEAPGPSGRMISVRFDANTSPELPWRFEPVDTHRFESVRVAQQAIAARGGQKADAKTQVAQETHQIEGAERA